MPAGRPVDILSVESNYLKKWAAGADVLKMRKLRPEDSFKGIA